ncbi:hypothetical protein CJ030_MR4G010929 [Morella rubra]|uniref:Uncharacterized protein n=1 Tax=Morella rubra TaxID=262757 RepID=A0A6A1VVB8_9ROSI|nr:hypothetical protein CJ030_MR4G010929 [Morella rubra]
MYHFPATKTRQITTINAATGSHALVSAPKFFGSYCLHLLLRPAASLLLLPLPFAVCHPPLLARIFLSLLLTLSAFRP